MLRGAIPEGLSGCTSLQHLDLSDNGFVGNIPDRIASSCTRLALAEVSYNRLNQRTYMQSSFAHWKRNLPNCEFKFMHQRKFVKKQDVEYDMHRVRKEGFSGVH